MDPVPGIGPLIVRGGEEIIRRNPQMSSGDKTAIRVASYGSGVILDPVGTTVSATIRGVKHAMKD